MFGADLSDPGRLARFADMIDGTKTVGRTMAVTDSFFIFNTQLSLKQT